jgi:hypothetical protein
MEIGILLALFALFFGGLTVAYGGYTLEQNHRLLALLSYVFGGGCIAAAIALAVLIVVGQPEEHAVVQAQATATASPEPKATRENSRKLATLTAQLKQAEEDKAAAFAKAEKEKRQCENFKRQVKDRVRHIQDTQMIDKVAEKATIYAITKQKLADTNKKLEELQGTHLLTPWFAAQVVQAQNNAYEAADAQRAAATNLANAKVELEQELNAFGPPWDPLTGEAW